MQDGNFQASSSHQGGHREGSYLRKRAVVPLEPVEVKHFYGFSLYFLVFMC